MTRNLRTALRAYVGEIHLGVRSERSVEQLRADLQEVARANGPYFGACVAMIAILFLVALGAVLRAQGKPDVAASALGLFAVSGAGLVKMMSNLWRDKVAIDMVLAAAAVLDADALRALVELLLYRTTLTAAARAPST